jgi:rSAM/selenodomain-associated transferase 2/rSAM/selenodomain-associated transferase 1
VAFGDRGNVERLIIFTRHPRPGRAKTRLIPALGPDGAADLQRRMTAQALATARRLARRRPVDVEVRFEGGGPGAVRRWLGPSYTCRPQGPGDLGERMRRAFEEAFASGAGGTLIVGSDCPVLSAEHLHRAFAGLLEHDLVLGPARDGGYYLIGARAGAPDVFGGIAWGTGGVLEHTLAAARGAGLSVALLDELADVDRTEDLATTSLAAGLPSAGGPAPAISVIVPVLNEGAHIRATLASARRGRDVEVIVVDGGSRDGTVALARRAGAPVIRGPACRAVQMNLGAAAAGGDVLLFLHGDTQLPEGFDGHVRQALQGPGVAAGAFRLRLDDAGRAVRLAEGIINWRTHRWRMPYGDQALFLRTELFRRLGGFPEMPIMEDYEMVRRLRRAGRIVVVGEPVLSSARRWRRLGVARTMLVNWAVVIGYRLGVPAERLAGWYRGG